MSALVARSMIEGTIGEVRAAANTKQGATIIRDNAGRMAVYGQDMVDGLAGLVRDGNNQIAVLAIFTIGLLGLNGVSTQSANDPLRQALFNRADRVMVTAAIALGLVRDPQYVALTQKQMKKIGVRSLEEFGKSYSEAVSRYLREGDF